MPLRIALVNLRSATNDWLHLRMVPLGLMYLSSALKQAYDARVEISMFDMTILAADEDATSLLKDWLEETLPDVVGIRGFSSHALEYPIVAKLAKTVRDDCLVVAGGPHASTGSEALHLDASIDFVVAGEGEETFVELVGNLLDGHEHEHTLGLGWSHEGRVCHSSPRGTIADLDAVALPDYSILDLEDYQRQLTMTAFQPERRFTSVFTSRGCHYQCTYCHDNFGKRVRYRSVENVVDELEFMVQEHSVGEFHIVDDIFNANRKRAVQIFNEIVKRKLDIRLAFPNGLRGDIMTEEFVAAAREAGAYHWAIAVESAVPRIQAIAQKNNKLDRVLNAIELSDRYGVYTCTFNMFGFPTETEEEMRATIEFNLASPAHMTAIFAVTPYEGTAMFDQAQSGGSKVDPAHGYHVFGDQEEPNNLSHVSRNRIEELILEATGRFYFDARRLRRMIELAPSTHALPHLALHVEERRWAVGYDYDSMPDREAARVLDELNRKAKDLAPELCAHLPLSQDSISPN